MDRQNKIAATFGVLATIALIVAMINAPRSSAIERNCVSNVDALYTDCWRPQ